MKNLFLLLSLLLPLTLNAQTTNPPGVLNAGGSSPTSNAPPGIQVTGVSSPNPVALYTGTNANPNGLVTGAVGSFYVQFNAGWTNYALIWVKGAGTISSNWISLSLPGNGVGWTNITATFFDTTAQSTVTSLVYSAISSAPFLSGYVSNNILYITCTNAAINFGTTVTAPMPSTNVIGAPGALNPTAGTVGEFTQTTVVAGSAKALTSGAATNLVAIPVTAGNWEVSGAAILIEASATVTDRSAAMNVVSNSLANADAPFRARNDTPTTTASQTNTLYLAPHIIQTSIPTNIFVNVQANFSAGTVTMYGYGYVKRAY